MSGDRFVDLPNAQHYLRNLQASSGEEKGLHEDDQVHKNRLVINVIKIVVNVLVNRMVSIGTDLP